MTSIFLGALLLLGIGAMVKLTMLERAWKSKVQHHRCVIIEIKPGMLAYDPVAKMWRRESDRAVYACDDGTLHERPCHGPCPKLGSAPPEAAGLGH